jgi:hypothetical protein
MIRIALIIAGLAACCLHCSGPARADTVVRTALVCKVQGAIRHRSPAWQAAVCDDVAQAVSETPWPRTVLSMMVLESDLRPDVVLEAKPGVFDVGVLGVRCVLSAGRRENGPARGYTIDDLKDPVTNIRVAAQIIAEKRDRFGKDWAWRYNGAKRDNGYGRKVRVLEAALYGKKLATKNQRVRKLAKQIRTSVSAPQT